MDPVCSPGTLVHLLRLATDDLRGAQQYRRGHLQRVATSSSSSSRVGGFFSSALSRKPPGTSINYTTEDLRGPLGLRVFEEPKDAFVELVFVHGFNGGARSTWTYNDDPATFWPSWLSDSQNSEFQNVRIHTFGYNSIDFQGRTTVANVSDVGTNFLESLANGPPFKRDAHVRLFSWQNRSVANMTLRIPLSSSLIL